MRLHIEFLPPDGQANTNQEQDFSMLIAPEQLQRMDDGEVGAGALVPFNNVRTQEFDRNLRPRGRPSALGKRVAALAKTVRIPIVLHNDVSRMRLTATEIAGGKRLWQFTFAYALDEAEFPRGPLASTWTLVSPARLAPANGALSVYATCKLSPEELYAETFEFTGPERPVGFAVVINGHNALVRLVVQHVRNAASKEPASMFMGERVWALRKFALIGDAALFQPLLPSRLSGSPPPIRPSQPDDPVVRRHLPLPIIYSALLFAFFASMLSLYSVGQRLF